MFDVKLHKTTTTKKSARAPACTPSKQSLSSDFLCVMVAFVDFVLLPKPVLTSPIL